MSDEVVQWLGEIRSLKEQSAKLQQERDQLKESEANWRNLYATEAQQRRTDAKLAQQQLEQLKSQLSELTLTRQIKKSNSSKAKMILEEELNGLDTLEALKEKLLEVMQERDDLRENLQQEQENHEQTRKSLTAVIGETVDQLAKERKTNT
jgi:chromosome segregation ATPase